MTPYFEQAGIMVYHADCLGVLPQLASGSVDAVVTDPPYNVGLNYKGDETQDNIANYVGWCDQWIAELKRLSRGAVAVSCGIANLGQWQASSPSWIFAWNKPNSMKRVATGWNTWEPVLVFGKILGKKTHDSFRVSIVPQKDTQDHPCPKPIGWALELIDRTTLSGMTVLDPFLGSGTTSVACIRTGRKCIGIEKEEKYCEIAVRRIEAELKAQREQLFPAEITA